MRVSLTFFPVTDRRPIDLMSLQTQLRQAMSRTTIATATRAQAETVIRWLKEEYLNELGGMSGFYCNRDVIRRAARDSGMLVLILGRSVIGFAVFNEYGIDLLEIRSRYRRRGHGRAFAEHIIQSLFASGSKKLNVHCAPAESQHFWRSLGFTDKEPEYQPWNVRLVLHNPVVRQASQ